LTKIEQRGMLTNTDFLHTCLIFCADHNGIADRERGRDRRLAKRVPDGKSQSGPIS